MLAHRMAIVDEFAKDAHVSPALKAELVNAICYSTEKSPFSWYDKLELLSELPKELRYEVAMGMHGGAARFISFLQNKDPSFLATLLPLLRGEMMRSGEVICRQGEYAGEMYFLTKGEVHFVDGKENHVYRVLKQGAYFGDVELLKGIARKYTVVAGTDCHFLTLSRKVAFTQFLGLIQRDFPLIWDEVNEVAEKREKVNSQALVQFQADQKLLSDLGLPISRDPPRRNSSVFLPSPTDPLFSLEEGVTELEQTLDSLEADMQATNGALEEALDLLRSQRGVKIKARLDPLPNKEMESGSEAPSKEAVTSDGKGWEGS